MKVLEIDAREMRLPQWAQAKMLQLRRTVEEQKVALSERTHNAKASGASAWTDIYDDDPIPVAWGTDWVSFSEDPSRREYIQVKRIEEGKVEIMASHRITVSPSSSNVITVQVCK